ncbi:hypothetical protein niasHS_017297 [Heterodera schachtii]|uniref:Protein kinase domain-containing protein n=1 Tax=Heterodera schachtii TaxID=97005 RepID=A0ABD2IA29_HETSC
MAPFKYESNQWKKQMEIKISAKYLQHNVFIGFTAENEKLPKNKCVIIKFYQKGFGYTYSESVEVSDKLREDSKNEEFFVTFMDHGTMDESEQLAKIFEPMMVIMELGERDLEEELQLVKGNFSTDKFNKMVMEVMGTLVQLHNVGIIHRDIAARNYIVFEKKEEGNLIIKRIKLADFDDSVPYLDGEEKASEEDLKELKNDIKQAGLLVSEMASIKILGLTNEQAVDTSRCIKTLFKSANREAIKAFASELSWQMILDILIVWKELPGISFLVGNMTSKDREQRMTAKGVADYLEGKCKPRQNGKSPEANCERRSPKRIKLFGKMLTEDEKGSAPGQSASGQSVSGQSVSGQSVSGQSVSGQSVSGQSVSGQSVSGKCVSGQSVSGQSISGQSASGHPVSGQSVSRHPVSGQSVSGQSVSGKCVSGQSPKDSWNVHLKMTLFGDVLVEKKLDDFEKIVIAKSLTSSAMEGIEHFVHELAERTEFCEQ